MTQLELLVDVDKVGPTLPRTYYLLEESTALLIPLMVDSIGGNNHGNQPVKSQKQKAIQPPALARVLALALPWPCLGLVSRPLNSSFSLLIFHEEHQHVEW